MKTLRFVFLVSMTILLVFPSCKKTGDEEVDYATIDRNIIRKYIKEHGLDADSTSSGLYYVINNPGVGARPNRYSYVKIRYKGYLINGQIFDEAKTPTTFLLTNLIQGWQEGIPLFKEGGSGILLIPSQLGYGNKATGDIPANSVLIFDIQLDEVLQ